MGGDETARRSVAWRRLALAIGLLLPGAGCGDAGDTGPKCGAGSAPELMACVERERYEGDLALVTGARPPGTAHWQEVQDLCADRLASLGYTVERHAYGTGVNVIGVRAGATSPAERVLVSAHYDGVPDCPAADDNGSGVAGLLEVARVMTSGTFARTLVVACWDEEEDGLIGSTAYAARAQADGEQLLGNYVYEMIGYFDDAPESQVLPEGLEALFPEEVAQLEAEGRRGDFITLIHDVGAAQQAQAMVDLGTQVGLKSVRLEVPEVFKNSDLISDLRRSDHAPFWEIDVPAIQITDTAEFRNRAYHCHQGDDVIGPLDPRRATRVVQATVGSLAGALLLLPGP